MAYEKHPSPLTWVVGYGFNSVLWMTVLVSHWLPNCTRRIICGECAFTSAPQGTYWRCRYDWKAPDITSAARGLLTWLLLLGLTTAAVCFVCVAADHVNSRSKLTNNANADHLFVSSFCSNYSSSARMTKYQHKVHSHCWLSSPKRVSTNRLFGLEDKKKPLNAKWKHWFPVKSTVLLPPYCF